MRFDSLILHGNIFENRIIRDIFSRLYQENIGYTLSIERLHEHTTPAIAHDQAVVS